MTNEIIYLTKCGCEVPKSGIYRSRTGHKTRILCREHKERIIGRKQMCQDCGEWYMLNDRGPGGTRCSECAEKRKTSMRRERLNIISKPREPAVRWSIDKRGDYCRALPDCEGRKCSGCPDFTGWWDPEKWWVPGVRL